MQALDFLISSLFLWNVIIVYIKNMEILNIFYVYVSGFSFTKIHFSQDSRGRWHYFYFLSTNFTHSTALAERLLQRAHLSTQLVSGTLGLQAQIANHLARHTLILNIDCIKEVSGLRQLSVK